MGANNGVDGSTTLYFEERGWTCILVEPNAALCREIRARRRARVFECAASSAAGMATLQVPQSDEGAHAVSALGGQEVSAKILETYGFSSKPVEVQTRTLDDILQEAGAPMGVDFISVDVEGHELEALKGLSLEVWRPTILIVENNSGRWRTEVSDHLGARGYVRFRRTGVNDWYARRTNHALAGCARRWGYYPSATLSQGLMALLKLAAPAAPALARLPGVLFLRDVIFGRRGVW